jgi:FHA domain
LTSGHADRILVVEAGIPDRYINDGQDGDAMAGDEDMDRRFPWPPPGRRNRKRWAIAAGIGVVWVFLLASTGSFIVGTVVLLLLMALTAGCIAGLRILGVDKEHPWVQLIRTRPWRNGHDVLRIGLRHLPEVFIVTPNGSRVAPNSVELRMNPDDLFTLAESLDIEFINSSATEFYREMLGKRSVRTAMPGPVEVSVIGDPSVPVGRYDLGQARRPNPGVLAGWGLTWQQEGRTRCADADESEMVTSVSTIKAPASLPLLRLITEDYVAETSVSGARAGRSGKLELRLPANPTVSRVHAEFTFDQGHWWITNLGRNGIVLNGESVHTTRPVTAGDSIRWGQQLDSPTSRVEIDWAPGQAA